MAARQDHGAGEARAAASTVANNAAASVFVGRARELDTAGECLDGALAGHGGVLLIAGEAGMGKTCLAEQVGERARALGTAVVWGRCVGEEGGPPFWPWRPVVRGCLASPAGRQLLAGLGAAAADLAGIVPDLATLHGTGGGGPVAIPAGGEERFRLFETVTAVLTGAAVRSGLVVVIDDLHWADPSSALLLAHLGRDLPGSRILVVAAYRDLEIDSGSPAAAALAALNRERGTTHVQLTGLTEAEVACQFEATYGRRFDKDVIIAVTRRSRGNPFSSRRSDGCWTRARGPASSTAAAGNKQSQPARARSSPGDLTGYHPKAGSFCAPQRWPAPPSTPLPSQPSALAPRSRSSISSTPRPRPA